MGQRVADIEPSRNNAQFELWPMTQLIHCHRPRPLGGRNTESSC